MIDSINCMIVDDEPKAIELLSETLQALYKGINIVGRYTSWTTALQALRTESCDLLFLDISMPGKTGFDLLKLLPDLACEVIFVTAHSDFALDAFKFNASGYILKPLDDVELVNAVNNATRRIRNRKLAAQNAAMPYAVINKKIGIPNNTGIDYINVDDIIFIESVNRTTKVVLQGSETGSSYNIGKFKTLLGPSFFQVHRSFIVNLNCIRRYDASGVVLMSNDKEIPVSKNIRDAFLSIFNSVSNKPEKA